MNPRRLYRCRHDRQLAGVAAGMAEYLDLDPTVVRVLWIMSALFGGVTILLYIVLAFVIPLEPAGEAPGSVGDPRAGSSPDGAAPDLEPAAPRFHRRPDDRRIGRGGLFLGVLLVVFGAIAMADTLIPGWVGGAHLGPALLVALGVVLLASSIRHGAYER